MILHSTHSTRAPGGTIPEPRDPRQRSHSTVPCLEPANIPPDLRDPVPAHGPISAGGHDGPGRCRLCRYAPITTLVGGAPIGRAGPRVVTIVRSAPHETGAKDRRELSRPDGSDRYSGGPCDRLRRASTKPGPTTATPPGHSPSPLSRQTPVYFRSVWVQFGSPAPQSSCTGPPLRR